MAGCVLRWPFFRARSPGVLMNALGFGWWYGFLGNWSHYMYQKYNRRFRVRLCPRPAQQSDQSRR
ncbi:hypothetical protein B0H12DRAFT_1148309 [Mycena haematopus]|nr:hypothetical protein B0H12DRAFT_1160489 [Mycena haematopus]KAJ7227866.1 hypothetical protein B0H12DRAFT_1148309 [Mycena haematopus]